MEYMFRPFQLTGLVFGLLMICLTGCNTISDEDIAALAKANLNDPAKCLTISITSEPSGAAVFGVKGGLFFQEPQPGQYLGTTPLILSYTRVRRLILGHVPDETLIIKESDASPMGPAQASLEFRCMLIKDGYNRVTVSKVIEDRTVENDPLGQARLQSLDSGVSKTYSVKLVAAKVKHGVLRITDTGSPVAPGHTAMTGPVAKPAQVRLTSFPEAAEIIVDGSFMGNTPCILPLPEGEHVIEAKLPGYTSYKRTLKVLPGSSLTIKAVLTKE